MRGTLIAIVLLSLSAQAFADADGPDFWRVTGIKKGEELNMRRGPSVKFGVAVKLPSTARQLLNLGCHPDFSPAEWKALTKKERALVKTMRWCHVMYQGQGGWVYARYLKED